jgi:hypothetical protein
MAKRETVVTDCDRCGGKKKRATVSKKLAVDTEVVALDLCEDHARLFDQQLGAWTRIGRDITPAKHEPFFVSTRERSHERARTIRPTPPPDDTKVVISQKLPAKFHTWNLTTHAIERCVERKISHTDALIAAADPAVARIDPQTGYWIHQRGDIVAIVNRNTSVVITAMTTETLAERQQKEVHVG